MKVKASKLVPLSKIQTGPSGEDITKVLPKLGIGVMFYKLEQYFFGASLPSILETKYDDYEGKWQSRHYYLTGGYVFKVSDNFALMPSFWVKYVSPAPVDLDFDLSTFIAGKILVGAGYGTEQFSAKVGYQFDQFVRVNYGYPYTTNELKEYNSGTHEIVFSVDFGGINEMNVMRPRFF